MSQEFGKHTEIVGGGWNPGDALGDALDTIVKGGWFRPSTNPASKRAAELFTPEGKRLLLALINPNNQLPVGEAQARSAEKVDISRTKERVANVIAAFGKYGYDVPRPGEMADAADVARADAKWMAGAFQGWVNGLLSA